MNKNEFQNEVKGYVSDIKQRFKKSEYQKAVGFALGSLVGLGTIIGAFAKENVSAGIIGTAIYLPTIYQAYKHYKKYAAAEKTDDVRYYNVKPDDIQDYNGSKRFDEDERQ